MANPNFSPTYSTNEIWRDTSRNRCLTDDLDAIESDIETLETGKADADHTHTGYAAANHSHSYNDLTNKPTIPTIPSSLPANGGNADTVDGKHAAEFAAAGHSHTDYAPKSHTHAGFAAANHTHSGYAATNHTHTGYAASGHTHSYNDLTNKPTIPSIPASLPANGGNADTLDGKHASAFASAAHVHGTTPVTEANTNLNDYAVAGVYSFSVANQPVNRPSGTSNGWLVVVPWTSNPTTADGQAVLAQARRHQLNRPRGIHPHKDRRLRLEFLGEGHHIERYDDYQRQRRCVCVVDGSGCRRKADRACSRHVYCLFTRWHIGRNDQCAERHGGLPLHHPQDW